MCQWDYPDRWPTVLTDISNALLSGNDQGILTGCITLFCLVKKYEYEFQKDREPLFKIMMQVTATLGQIVEQYLTQLDNEVALAILH